MFKYTVEVHGMMCNMCEAHTNDAIRKAFKVAKVTSSHTRNETVFFSEADITNEQLQGVFDELGYDMGGIRKEPARKGLFGWK